MKRDYTYSENGILDTECPVLKNEIMVGSCYCDDCDFNIISHELLNFVECRFESEMDEYLECFI
jgi:hypothetical protein